MSATTIVNKKHQAYNFFFNSMIAKSHTAAVDSRIAEEAPWLDNIMQASQSHVFNS